MNINFVGLDFAPEKLVPASEIRDCRWAEKGCFKSEYTWEENGDVLTVRFTLKRLIDNKLVGKELNDVKAHEKKHYDDYVKAANNLKRALQNAANLKKPLDMDNRMAWFDWDVIQDSNSYHRTLGMMPTVELSPSNPRPNP